MVARYWRPLEGDDAYNVIRGRFGDTTDPLAQIAALRALGLDATFRVDGTADLLERELVARRPVAVGWLHHGHVTAPAGGGHWGVMMTLGEGWAGIGSRQSVGLAIPVGVLDGPELRFVGPLDQLVFNP